MNMKLSVQTLRAAAAASALACALGCAAQGTHSAQGTSGAGASGIITGISGLYIGLSIQTRRDLCGARFKATRSDWAERSRRWQERNAPVLAELRALADKHEGQPVPGAAPTSPAEAAAAAVVRQFKMMATLAPATNLAPLADEPAAWVCNQWLADLEPAGKVDQTLPVLLAAARKLQVQAP
jgi:hypothetical protein